MASKLIVAMTGRSPDEPHRSATTLELLFDLVFVVAIAQAAAGLHHAIAEAHVVDGLIKYVMVFFTIWWAWMNFTWFATSYDTDDVPYRLAVFVQLAGALILAAGVSSMFENMDTRAITIGYVVMRVATVTQWIRAGRSDPQNSRTAFRMAGGMAALQVLWVGLLFAPASWMMPGFFVLLAGELAVPVWASSGLSRLWHREHIAERYGLLTIIVLGETILAASLALQGTIKAHELSTSLLPIMFGGLLTVYALWWLYFSRDSAELLTSVSKAFVWGYGHYLIYASGAAVGAGIAVAVDHATHHAHIGSFGAGMAVAAPVAVFLLSLSLLHARDDDPVSLKITAYIAIALVLLTPLTPQPVLLVGLILAALVAIKVIRAEPASQ